MKKILLFGIGFCFLFSSNVISQEITTHEYNKVVNIYNLLLYSYEKLTNEYDSLYNEYNALYKENSNNVLDYNNLALEFEKSVTSADSLENENYSLKKETCLLQKDLSAALWEITVLRVCLEIKLDETTNSDIKETIKTISQKNILFNKDVEKLKKLLENL